MIPTTHSQSKSQSQPQPHHHPNQTTLTHHSTRNEHRCRWQWKHPSQSITHTRDDSLHHFIPSSSLLATLTDILTLSPHLPFVLYSISGDDASASASASEPKPSSSTILSFRGSSSPSPSPSSSPSSSTSSSSSSSKSVNNNNNNTRAIMSNQHKQDMIVAGLVSGVIVAGAFNPWDRALYLSVNYKRPFLSRENFVQPYKGFWQVLFHRTLSGGIYFPLFDFFSPSISHFVYEKTNIPKYLSPAATGSFVAFLAGNTAGAMSAILLNHFTAIKYASWDGQYGFTKTAITMWHQGGIRPFLKGIGPTIVRDTVFGGVFACCKYAFAQRIAKSPGEWKKTKDFLAGIVAGGMATILSAPFNYVRNVKYFTPATQIPRTSIQIFHDLFKEAKASRNPAGVITNQLRLGWGTARVAVGMSVGFEIYELTKDFLDRRHLGREVQHPISLNSTKIATPLQHTYIHENTKTKLKPHQHHLDTVVIQTKTSLTTAADDEPIISTSSTTSASTAPTTTQR